MMRKMILRLALLGTAAALPAYAQTSPATPDRDRPAAATEGSTRPDMAAPAPGVAPSATTPSTSRSGATTPNPSAERSQRAVTTDDGTRTATTLVPGANSFTEGQARSRIEAAGFSGVGELRKDDQGIWRGQATRGGQQVGVALDYLGNVAAQ